MGEGSQLLFPDRPNIKKFYNPAFIGFPFVLDGGSVAFCGERVFVG